MYYVELRKVIRRHLEWFEAADLIVKGIPKICNCSLIAGAERQIFYGGDSHSPWRDKIARIYQGMLLPRRCHSDSRYFCYKTPSQNADLQCADGLPSRPFLSCCIGMLF